MYDFNCLALFIVILGFLWVGGCFIFDYLLGGKKEEKKPLTDTEAIAKLDDALHDYYIKEEYLEAIEMGKKALQERKEGTNEMTKDDILTNPNAKPTVDEAIAALSAEPSGVPMSVIEDIKAEIKEHSEREYMDGDIVANEILAIIDKHIS